MPDQTPKLHATVIEAIACLDQLGLYPDEHEIEWLERRDAAKAALMRLVLPAHPEAELAAMAADDRIVWKLGAAIVHEQPVDVLKALAAFVRTCCDRFHISHESFVDLMSGEIKESARG